MNDSQHSAALPIVRVWFAELEATEPGRDGSEEAWSDSTRQRMDALNAPRRRAQFKLARLLLQHGVGQLQGRQMPLSEIDDSGLFPRLSSPSGLHASVSHSQQIVAVLLATERYGLDLECFDLEREFLALAARLYQPGERSWLRHARTPRALRDRFYRIWTAREAAFKAGLIDPVTAGPDWVSNGEFQPPWPSANRITPQFCVTVVGAHPCQLSVVRAKLHGMDAQA